jgi:hypothetical protein
MYEYFLGSFPPRRDALRRRDVRRVVVWGTTRRNRIPIFRDGAVVKVAPDHNQASFVQCIYTTRCKKGGELLLFCMVKQCEWKFGWDDPKRGTKDDRAR